MEQKEKKVNFTGNLIGLKVGIETICRVRLVQKCSGL